MGFMTSFLTSIHISFTKIFCQNKVKRNCKYSFVFFIKEADVKRKEWYVEHSSDVR